MMLKKCTITLIIWSVFTQIAIGQLYINEVVASNNSTIADANGEYDDWIEIYNAGAAAIDLAGYYISDDTGNPTLWQIPTGNSALTTVPANGYLLLWADEETFQGENHLNFKLSSSGETILLTAPDEVTLIDNITFSEVATDFGYGRLPDGAANLGLLIPASPAASNNNSQPQATLPVILPPNGVYNTAQTVSITTEAGASIYYSLDGTDPTTSSTLYTGAFTVNTSQSVRAISVKSGFVNSQIETTAYVIGSNHDLAVLSVNISPEYLWSDSLGMYVVGTNGIAGCGEPANYHQEWEYPANVIMFDEAGNEAFDLDGGLSVFGNCSRRYAQKSIQFKTKSEYPSPNIPYQVFPQREQDEFRRLRFRNAGNHWTSSMMGDAVVQRLVENKLDLEIQSARPSVVYLNGEYWGIHNIRDSYSHHYFKYKYPKYEEDSIEIMRIRNLHYDIVATDGDTTNLHNLYQYFKNNQNFTQSNYDYARSRIDTDNFLNYYMLQMWVFPWDWPGTSSPSNKIYWRSATSDSKWRMAVLDTDLGWLQPEHNTIQYMMVAGNTNQRNSPMCTMLFRHMMDIPEFRSEFIQRYATQLNLIYSPQNVNETIDDYKNLLDSEMTAHTTLWGPQGGVADYNAWIGEVNVLKDFADVRSDSMRGYIIDFFGLSTFDLTLDFDVNTNGKVVVNSNYFEVPFNYTGEYFTDTPIEIHAIPNPGYRFAYWQETGSTDATLYQSFNTNTTLTPVFEPALDVVINEIHYHPNDSINNKEFIEIYNPDIKAWDLTKYSFESGICFEFPEGTSIAPGEYIIIAADASQYLGNGYQVFQWEESKLDNDGEKLVLHNAVRTTIDSVRYNDGIPWALLADGFGNSLELNYPLPADNLMAADWHASAPSGGTPGTQNSTPCTTPTQEIVINEINYNSSTSPNPGDWIELYNPSGNAVDLSDWGFYDSGSSFNIPNGTILEPDAFLVLTENAANFATTFPHLSNGTDYIGDWTFKFSNSGERVSLFDNNKCLSDELDYNDNIPWDTIPDGNGPTLSLITPNLDNSLPISWEASSNINAAYGTPGRENTPCPESIIMLPDTICAGFPASISIDSLYPRMTLIWSLFGATPSSLTTETVTPVWNTPGTYNVQLITRYFECTKIYNQQVTVTSCNDAPIAVDDNFTAIQETPLNEDLSPNDSDPNGNNLSWTSLPVVAPANGLLLINSDGTFTYTPNLGFTGNDSFVYQVCDDATVNAATPNIFIGQVSSSADDVEELALDGSINTTSGDLDMMDDSGEVFTAVGIRITNINIPQNATITSARLEFVADENNSQATSLSISAEAIGNAAPFSITPFAISNKTKTSTANWSNIPAWTAGNTYSTTDISTVIQEVVSRADWQRSNAMTFMIEGTGTRTPESYDGGASVAPRLIVHYELPDNTLNVSLCSEATVNITVEQGCIDLDIYAYLEGPYDRSIGEMTSELNMLRGLLPGQTPFSNLANPTSAGQPYNMSPWNYAGTEGTAWTDANYTDDVVDWVLVSTRTDIAKSSEIGRAAGLLYKDGSISLSESCALENLGLDSVYVVIEHRNHMGIMTPQKAPIINTTLTYDFRLSDSYKDATSFGQKQASTGDWLMFAGDGNQSDFPSFDIQGTDKAIWLDDNGIFQQYLIPDFDLNGDVNGADKALWFENNGVSSRVPK